MKLNFNKQKSTYLLLFFYLTLLSFAFFSLQDTGVHIEEKFHRLNGHYWLNYVSEVLGFNNLYDITSKKISEISDFSLSSVSLYNKYGIIFDLPTAFLEIFLGINNIKSVYYLKHFLSFFIFLLSSFAFYRILIRRYDNFLLSFVGTSLFITTPRIFGDSFFYKDVLFLSFLTFTIYFFLKYLKKNKLKNLILFSLFTAFSVNLRIFSILIPFLFCFIIFIKSFQTKEYKENIKKILLYLIFFFFYLFIFWPYLWASPINNFIDLFLSLNTDLIDVKILYNQNYISNRTLPNGYLFNWLIISSPIFQSLLFFIGYFFYLIRLLNRYFKINEISVYNDLWRGHREETDFIFFIFLSSFYLLFLVFNAPLYNGWRLVYFMNFFMIYFSINILNIMVIRFQKKRILYALLNIFLVILVSYNYYAIIKYHPYQSLYFNNFFSEKKINGFEGDYHGISSKDFFDKISEIDKDNEIKIAVASHTPLHRGLEALELKKRSKFLVVGQEYEMAKYIYKNNISEVDSILNKKYEVPKNFSKVYEKKIGKLIIYEIFKKN